MNLHPLGIADPEVAAALNGEILRQRRRWS